MSDIKMKLGYVCSTVEIPTIFIDDYFTDCLPVYPLIYIWSLRRLLDGGLASLDEIGKQFRLTESDVIKAWKHWEDAGLVSISTENAGMEITFLPIAKRQGAQNETRVIETEKPTTAPPMLSPSAAPTPIEMRPKYTAQELACYRSQNRDIERLFARAEQALGKLLSYNDMNVIFGFYDWLRLPIDVLEYLLAYCSENDHRNLRYIEKCALDWADHDIDDLEKALTYVQIFDKGYRTILQHMGQVSGYPTPTQRKLMDKWLREWNMPLELATEACDRCVNQTAKPNFKYVDKILSEWNKKGFTTMEAVHADDNEFAAATKPSVMRSAKPATPKANRFINFNQRENNYEQYERLEREYLDTVLEA